MNLMTIVEASDSEVLAEVAIQSDDASANAENPFLVADVPAADDDVSEESFSPTEMAAIHAMRRLQAKLGEIIMPMAGSTSPPSSRLVTEVLTEAKPHHSRYLEQRRPSIAKAPRRAFADSQRFGQVVNPTPAEEIRQNRFREKTYRPIDFHVLGIDITHSTIENEAFHDSVLRVYTSCSSVGSDMSKPSAVSALAAVLQRLVQAESGFSVRTG